MSPGNYRSKEEQLRLGGRAADLRDLDGLKWRVITERLGVNDINRTIVYYKKYKAMLKSAKDKMNLEQIEKFASRHGIERGWIWLFENGFKRRVPQEVRGEIEAAKMRNY